MTLTNKLLDTIECGIDSCSNGYNYHYHTQLPTYRPPPFQTILTMRPHCTKETAEVSHSPTIEGCLLRMSHVRAYDLLEKMVQQHDIDLDHVEPVSLPVCTQWLIAFAVQRIVTTAHEGRLCGTGFLRSMRTVFGSKRLLGRLAFGASLFAWQNGTGINAINYYSPTIFRSIGITGTSTSLLTTGVFGIIKLLGALIWLLYMVDSLGRRSLLMIGSFGGALSMYYIGAYIAIAKPQNRPAGTGVLDAGGRSAAMSNWLFGFLIARFTPQMFTAMGYRVYIFFATLMILSIFFVYFILPETKQVPLERMEELFAPGLKPWKAHAVVMGRMRVSHEKRLEEVEGDADGETVADGKGGSIKKEGLVRRTS
ncbi:hypothetical protein BDQ12DRAFT_663794 [Crucibulum laeve]|uniref:Major facilitator superfamily (MFS) profile domain-containing protein n=1 Tax=Crucibulum laeve TaxID=68775 RepID=A0A5C3M8N1_9AGAR|nr:hypothetical protein BDQ12DRAFT_663794 [Crucibulum laeve]